MLCAEVMMGLSPISDTNRCAVLLVKRINPPSHCMAWTGKFCLQVSLYIITARKRSFLRRLCLTPVCHSVRRESVCLSACWDTPQAEPQGADPPCAVHAGRYGQNAGGTHPTGMYTCHVCLYLASCIITSAFAKRNSCVKLSPQFLLSLNA